MRIVLQAGQHLFCVQGTGEEDDGPLGLVRVVLLPDLRVSVLLPPPESDLWREPRPDLPRSTVKRIESLVLAAQQRERAARQALGFWQAMLASHERRFQLFARLAGRRWVPGDPPLFRRWQCLVSLAVKATGHRVWEAENNVRRVESGRPPSPLRDPYSPQFVALALRAHS